MKKTLILLSALSLSAIGNAFCQGDATLRAGDSFDLRISGVPTDDQSTISSNYTVDGQGYLNLSYIGKIKVAGRTASEIQSTVEHMYVSEGIFTHPTVAINIAATSRFVNIGGPGVKSGARIPYTADMTLLSAIMAGGDFNEFADQRKVRLIRAGKVQVIDCKKIRQDPSKDIAVLPGDNIQVPQTIF